MKIYKGKKRLEQILNYPNVSWTRVDKDQYLIVYREESWLLWSKSKKFKSASKGLPTSDFYLAGLEHFYQRNILKCISLPQNNCKIWDSKEEDILYDMIQLRQTAADVSRELKRLPREILWKVSILNENYDLFSIVSENLYEVPLLDIVELNTLE